MVACSPRRGRRLHPCCQVTEGDANGPKYLHPRVLSLPLGITAVKPVHNVTALPLKTANSKVLHPSPTPSSRFGKEMARELGNGGVLTLAVVGGQRANSFALVNATKITHRLLAPRKVLLSEGRDAPNL